MYARKLPARQAGFTLIELLVVIVILAILAAVVVPQVLGHIEEARVSAAKSNVKTFDDALEVYELNTHGVPTTEQGLQALVTNPGVPGWSGPYLKGQESVPLDPWQHAYVYKSPGDNGSEYEIATTSASGQLITNTNLGQQ